MSAATAFPAAAIPSQLTEFVGRSQELEMIIRLVGESRLLTLTGAGGSGKTRLAHAVACATAARPDAPDVAWIELAPLNDPASVMPTVALALGAPNDARSPTLPAMMALLRERDALIVLDNCEHLLDACAALADALLRGCPRLTILATSRESLGVAGERSWLVPPLAVPGTGAHTVSDALEAGAVMLFVARASDASPSFVLSEQNVDDVVRICRRLDGLPLALELAAARIAVMPPAQLADRLGDRFALLTSGARAASRRQRTLRGTVDWSYELLDPPERLLLERLSIFNGGFTLDAAEAVCGVGELPQARVLETLAALATKSLVAMQEEAGGARYRLLETIREYALERHAERSDAAPLAERHASYYRDLARALEEDVIVARTDAMHLIDGEHGNLSDALAWSHAVGRGADIGLPLVRSLTWYWYHRQLWAEGYEAAEQAIASSESLPLVLHGTALHALGVFGLHLGNPRAGEYVAAARACWERTDDERWQGYTLIVSAVAEAIVGNWETSREFAERAIAVTSRQSSPWDRALATAHCYVAVLSAAGEWERATELLEECIAIYRRVGYPIGIPYALDALAFTRFQLGERGRAAALAGQAIREDASGQNRWLVARSLRLLASVAEHAGDDVLALRLYAAGQAALDSIGAALLTAERPFLNELPERLRARVQPADFESAWAAGYTMRYREAVALALQSAEAMSPTERVDARLPSPTRATTDEPCAGASLPAPGALEVRTLGRLELRLHGRLLTDEDWPYAKPRELLLYLLAHPEGRTRGQIGLDFWPDVSAAQVKNNFHVTLHHLRKTLGDAGWVRFEQGRYRIARERGVRYDAEVVESALADSLRALRDNPGDAAAAVRLSEALASVTGRFLEDVAAGDWHLETRDRLARLREAAFLELAHHFSVEGRHEAAAAQCCGLLRLDPLHEEATALLMMSWARAEKRADALRAFDRHVDELQRVLAAAPSKRLLELQKAIRGGQPV